MKKSVKLMSVLLALVLVFSLLPVTALATTAAIPSTPLTPATPTDTYRSKVTVIAYCYAGTLGSATATINVPTMFSGNTFGQFITAYGKVFEYAGGVYPVYPDNADHTVYLPYIEHSHEYRNGYDRENHWEACRCGSTLSFGPHVDPAKDDDSICTCGYKFSNNADLSTLWLKNMNLEPRFHKDTTEYQAEVYTYKPVDSTSISVNPNDGKATVELPKDTSIHEGMNIFEIKVTAEDTKTTQTYVVYASLPSKVDGVLVSNTGNLKDGFVTTLEPKTTVRRTTASMTVPKNMGDAIATQVESVDSKQIVMEPIYSKWSIKVVEVSIPAEVLEQLGELDVELVIKTFSGNIVVPSAEMKNLAKEGENILFKLDKTEGDPVLTITADEKEVKNDNVKLEAPEK